MFKLKSQESVRLTKKLAKQIIAMRCFDGDRHYNAKRKRMLIDAMNDGSFSSARIAIAELDGEELRMNGRHTCMAFLSKECVPQRAIHICLERYRLEEERDLSGLFETFDKPESVRSLAQCVNARRVVTAEIKSVRQQYVMAALTGLLAHYDGASCGPMRKATSTKKVDLIEKHPDVVLFFEEILSSRGCPRGFQMRAVKWAIVDTYFADESMARDFWTKVRDGIELRSGDPCLVLRNYLQEIRNDPNYSMKPASVQRLYHKIIWCWSKHADGKRVRTIRLPRDVKKLEETCSLRHRKEAS